MNEAASEQGLNENHRRRLLVSCQHIDKLLSDVEAILNSSSSKSPFAKYVDDISNVQRKMILDYVSRIRTRLVKILQMQDIANLKPQVSSAFAIQTILNFIEISAEELRAKQMSGYGVVTGQAALELNGVAGELGAIAKELNLFIAQGNNHDLNTRVNRLESSGVGGSTLLEIERIVSERGLVEFQRPLSLIVERLEDERFEIAFFGRVSTGKSSLLNYILKSNILPVGVNPITAVPTSISFGKEPRLSVRFAGRRQEIVGIEKLAEFAAEQFNPANEKNVIRLDVEVANERLDNGIVFVDTPGLGSLAVSGSNETIAYLPRCDLGVVLIDASSTLTDEDLGTVRALYQASIRCMILLSKADLLTDEDRRQALRYIEANIRSNLGVKLQVHPVSTVPTFGSWADDWFERYIHPLYAQSQKLKADSMGRKIVSLREDVEASLTLKLGNGNGNFQIDPETSREIEISLGISYGKIERTEDVCRNLLNDITRLDEEIWRKLVLKLLQSRDSVRNAHDDLSLLYKSVAEGVVAEKAAEIYKEVTMLLGGLEKSLSNAADAMNNVGMMNVSYTDEQFQRIQMPLFDAGNTSFSLDHPLLFAFGKKAARYAVERRLKNQGGPTLTRALQYYRDVLADWISSEMRQIRQQYEATAGVYRARMSYATNGKVSHSESVGIRRDIESLNRGRKTDAAA